MALAPAITDLEQLKDRPEVAALMSHDAVQAARFDRNELTIWIAREDLLDAMQFLRDDSHMAFNLLSDVTCVDWYPSTPRFEVVYQLTSISRKARLRVKVKLEENGAKLASIINIWPSANFFEREVFDLFGITFEGHPFLRRIMMPEDWKGHPLRKDYPVEGYR